jgi:predicted phosphodiesterase
MPHGALAGLGDLFEGCAGFYPNQPFLIDRNRRDQGKITRELITHAIDELSPLFDVFTAATVGGNHGENRQDGKKVTDDADNDDVAAFEAVKEAFDRAGHTEIDWVIPDDELSIALELGGVKLGLTHGHLFRRGSTVQAKAHEWWKGQAFGLQPVHDAQLLVSGHFHHFSAVTYGARTALQTPAMDPGSKWYRDSSGEDSPAGVLTMRIDETSTLGYDDLRILSPGRS